MGVILKETIKGSLYQYAGILLGGINTLLLFPKFLGDENWGILSIIIGIVTISSQFSQLGSSNIVFKYFPRYKQNEIQKGFVKLSLLINLFGTLLFCCIFLIFKDSLLESYDTSWTKSTPIIVGIILFLIFHSTLNLVVAYLNICLKTSFGFLLKELILRSLQSIVVIIFFISNISLEFFLYLFILTYIITTAIGFIYLFIKKLILPSELTEKIEFLDIKEYFTYGTFTILTGFGSIFIANIDILMLGAILENGEVLAGKYKSAIHLTSLIFIPLRPLYQIMYTLVSNWWNENKRKEINLLYRQSILIGIFTTGLLLLLLLVNLNWITYYLFNNLEGCFYVVLFFGLGQIANGATGINVVLINLSPFYKFNTYFLAILMFINYLLNYYFIDLLGLSGAAIATGIGVTIIHLGNYILVSVKLGYKPFNLQLSMLLIVIIVMLITVERLSFYNYLNEFNSILLSIIIIVTGYIFIYLSGLQKKLLDLIRKK